MAAQCLVLGGGVAGLSSAIYARLRGFDVLLLEQSDQVGGKAAGVPCGPDILDPGPTIIILTEIYEQLFRDAGRKMEDYLQFDRLDPFSRVMWRDDQWRLDLPADREACLSELGRAFPEDEAALRGLLDKLDKTTQGVEQTIFRAPVDRWWQMLDPRLIRFGTQFDPRLSYKELIDQSFKAPLLRAFLYGFPSYSGQTYHSKAAGALLIPYYMIQSGVYYPRGGVAAIPAAFHRLAEELGVKFRLNAKVKEAERNARRVTKIRLESGESIDVERLICATDRLTFQKMLGQPSEAKPSDSYFTQQWVLNRKIDDLAHHAVMVPEGFEKGFQRIYDHGQTPDPPIIYLNAPILPSGRTSLFAVTSVPACREPMDWDAEALLMRQRVREGLERFGIAFDDSEIDFHREQTPQFFRDAHGNWGGSLYGPREDQRLWGMLPLPNRDRRLRNVAYAGCSVQPGAGLPMVTLSGKFAAGLL